jgi:hypothetical protein
LDSTAIHFNGFDQLEVCESSGRQSVGKPKEVCSATEGLNQKPGEGQKQMIAYSQNRYD